MYLFIYLFIYCKLKLKINGKGLGNTKLPGYDETSLRGRRAKEGGGS